jgi:hypothetical protein
MSSEIKADKWSPASGTSATIGDSGDTYTVPSGVTLNTSSATLTLPSSVVTGQTAITSLADTDKFLVSDASDSGNLKYVENQYLGGGSLNFITSNFSSSNHSEVVFDNCFTSSYVNYFIIGDISITNSGDTVRARLKNSGGQLTGSQYVYRFQRYSSDSNTSTNNTRATGDSYFQLTEGLNDNSARVGYTFKIYIFDPLSTSKRMGLRQESVTVNNSAVMDSVSGAGQYKDQTAITGILFYPSGNNFSNSNIRIYGISNS